MADGQWQIALQPGRKGRLASVSGLHMPCAICHVPLPTGGRRLIVCSLAAFRARRFPLRNPPSSIKALLGVRSHSLISGFIAGDNPPSSQRWRPCAAEDCVWDLPAGPEAFRQQAWSIRLGRGARLRCLDLPIPLTRPMEHHARRAPDHYTVIEALRYGETLGLGGTERLAREIATSRLGRETAHCDFRDFRLSVDASHLLL